MTNQQAEDFSKANNINNYQVGRHSGEWFEPLELYFDDGSMVIVGNWYDPDGYASMTPSMGTMKKEPTVSEIRAEMQAYRKNSMSHPIAVESSF